jgi:hypothetical protein
VTTNDTNVREVKGVKSLWHQTDAPESGKKDGGQENGEVNAKTQGTKAGIPQPGMNADFTAGHGKKTAEVNQNDHAIT